MNKQQLANKIWESANKMRSKIEANEYKDYILGFIFYKFLSDKEVDFLKKDGYEETDLQEHVHENNEELVDYCQQQLGYFIAYDNLFSTWLDKGNSFTVDNVRTALSAFNRLISDTQKKVFSKIFNTLETGLSKLGDSTSNQTKAIRDLIQLIKDIPTDGRQDYDVLGFIYEYLISNFAANAGKKAGEFYTPHEVSQLMSEIVANHLKDREKIEIYDPTSGSGSLYLPVSQYEREEHQCAVVDDILENWTTLSHDSKFHAIFATSSIPEAIQYYKLFKAKGNLKITALFDPSIDNNGNGLFKEEGIVEIIKDYNTRYSMEFQMATYATFKKDISYRLAHKEQYKGIEHTSDQQIDLLIVVDQMLTGFDSKWINTLYLDKILVYEKLIQAFSRTNRLYGPEKPFGTIRYYRKPYTMQKNIEEAFKLYSGDRPLGLFADKLEHNLEKMNALYDDIGSIFRSAGIENFEKLPVDHTERGQFAKLFKQLNSYLEAAKIQGFTWNKLSYEFKNVGRKVIINLHLDETTYLILALRYKELFASGSGEAGVEDVPYEIDSYLTEINTGVIDANYMNSRFKKYIKALQDGTETAAVLDELHKSFATLTQEEQKYANIFLHDVQNGDVIVDEGKTLRNYITEYMTSAKNDQIHRFATAIGVDETILRSFMQSKITEANINEFGKFDTLKATVDTEKAKTFLEMIEGKPIKKFQINMKIDQMLRRFILEGGFDIT